MNEQNAGLLQAGMSLAGGIATGLMNRAEVRRQNASDREFQKWFYNQQLADSRQDWAHQWATQTEYNSPEAMMNRYRQAGLNPHLIYGKGAEMTAPTMRGASPPSTGQSPHQFQGNPIGEAIGAYNDVRIRQAQTDNVYAQTELLAKEALQKDAQTANILQDTATSKFQLQQAGELKDMVVQQARLNNEKSTADISYTKSSERISLDRNERERLANSANVAKTLQDILESKLRTSKITDEKELLKQQLINAKKEEELRELDLRLKRQGIQPSDPSWMRIMTQFLSSGVPPMIRMSYESGKSNKRDYSGFGRAYQGRR